MTLLNKTNTQDWTAFKNELCTIFTKERFFEIRGNFKKHVKEKKHSSPVYVYALNAIISGKNPKCAFYTKDGANLDTFTKTMNYLEGYLANESDSTLSRLAGYQLIWNGKDHVKVSQLINECFKLTEEEKSAIYLCLAKVSAQ